MAVSIAQPQQRESGLDKFLKVVQGIGGVANIAKSGYDLYNAGEDRRLAQEQSALDRQLKKLQADKMAQEISPESMARQADREAAELAKLRADTEYTQKRPQYERQEFRDRQEQRNYERDVKKQEKDEMLNVPGVGMAITPDDAKNLKDAVESKKSFDAKLDELISLRKEYGGELLNRTAVSRAKQLSKDLLLQYKNMAKLGTLSQSDEDIINAILPSDPLQFTTTGTGDVDPILNNLQKFKEDTDRDFQSKIGLRTRKGGLGDLVEQTKKLSPEDMQALDWAEKNPKDPRAIEIKKRLGK